MDLLIFGTVLFFVLGLRRAALHRQTRLQRRIGQGQGETRRVRTERAESKIGFVRRIQQEAWQAGLAMSAQTVMTLMVVGGAVGFLALEFFTDSTLIALAGAVVGLLVPRWYLRHQKAQRTQVVAQQLPGALRMWASAMRSGMGVQESLGLIIRELRDPLKGEMDRGYRAMTLGAKPDEAMAGVALRIGQEDFGLVVTALEMHFVHGGNLAEQLERVADTVTERSEARQSALAKTAQARASTYIIMAIPAVFLTITQATNHGYIAMLLGTTPGLEVFVAALALIAVAYLIVRRVTDIPFV